MEENEKYVPPYSLTSKMLELIAEIMEKVGQISKFVNFKKITAAPKGAAVKLILMRRSP